MTEVPFEQYKAAQQLHSISELQKSLRGDVGSIQNAELANARLYGSTNRPIRLGKRRQLRLACPKPSFESTLLAMFSPVAVRWAYFIIGLHYGRIKDTSGIPDITIGNLPRVQKHKDMKVMAIRRTATTQLLLGVELDELDDATFDPKTHEPIEKLNKSTCPTVESLDKGSFVTVEGGKEYSKPSTQFKSRLDIAIQRAIDGTVESVRRRK